MYAIGSGYAKKDVNEIFAKPPFSLCLYYYVEMCFLYTSAFFYLPAAGLFSCPRLRGTQGARPNTTAQVWALAEVRDTYSRGSKTQSSHGEAFRARKSHPGPCKPT